MKGCPGRWSLPAFLGSVISASAFADEAPVARIHGLVLDAASGRLLPGAEVLAGEIAVRTDARGASALSLTPGTWTLEARATDHTARHETHG